MYVLALGWGGQRGGLDSVNMSGWFLSTLSCQTWYDFKGRWGGGGEKSEGSISVDSGLPLWDCTSCKVLENKDV